MYEFKKKLKKKNIKLVLLNKNNFQLGIKSYLFSTIIIPNAWSFGLKIIDIAKKLQVPNICIYHTESFEISNTYLESKYPLNELHQGVLLTTTNIIVTLTLLDNINILIQILLIIKKKQFTTIKKL